MAFTKEQIERLSKYESYFETAVYHSWSRCPNKPALEEMLEVYNEATGMKRKINGSCQNCILNLLKDCGKLYYESKNAVKETPKKRTRKTSK